ncbi:hypothetical protein T01_6975 [Trichinella spiralis]|uniref:Uncharacterized protein n=1 Tax=Trichinella spiralis TaxID=6334 RepID=A0A0V1BS11_TRISP|nr:hypothetical protein T01_6975 [Trichinella spiralis]
MRVCHGKLYSNLAATQVIRTSEHADGRDPRPVTEVYDELPSNASTILDTPLAFQLEGRPGTMYNRRSRRYPRHPARRQDLRLTAEQTRTNSGCWFRVTAGTGMGPLRLSHPKRGLQLDSTTFLCDFETALIPAIQGNFPNTQMQGCFFHFCQAEAESENADGISIFADEPCTPGFEILDVGILGQMEAFFQYFQREWLLDAKIPLCNVYGVAVPTINHLEGWHSGMNKRARKNHLGFCQFLQLIIDEQGKTETVVRQMDDGYTWGRGSVRRSAAYGVRQRRPITDQSPYSLSTTSQLPKGSGVGGIWYRTKPD